MRFYEKFIKRKIWELWDYIACRLEISYETRNFEANVDIAGSQTFQFTLQRTPHSQLDSSHADFHSVFSKNPTILPEENFQLHDKAHPHLNKNKIDNIITARKSN